MNDYSSSVEDNNSGGGGGAIFESARHLCEEARVVLTSLRGGPPNVARGDLAQDLMDLRSVVKNMLSTNMEGLMNGTVGRGVESSARFVGQPNNNQGTTAIMSALDATAGLDPPGVSSSGGSTGATTSTSPQKNGGETLTQNKIPSSLSGAALPVPVQPYPENEDASEGSSAVFVEAPSVGNQQHQQHNRLLDEVDPRQHYPVSPIQDQPHRKAGMAPIPMIPHNQDVGPYARPFLAVVMDPRAAGPHTLVALRALYRLLERKSLQPLGGSLPSQPGFGVAIEPLTKGVLNCKFEQTDAGADEAVEMAIADLLALVVKIDRRAIENETLMDAFNTVFVTRNTFVHSPALCYHFEDVLTTIVRAVFEDLDGLSDPAGRLILEFLVNQLLHTPLVGGDDEASREAQMAHDATRVLCLRLTRWTLKCGFQNVGHQELMEAANASPDEERGLMQIIQDDLCLSLLLTGQAIWAYQENPNIAPGFISMEVLSEICSTMSTLWGSINLRVHLVPQFEAIFSGFYQRALVLLRKRSNPTDSDSFHANLIFDAGVEIILESLVDIMSLHDHRTTVAQGNGGCLETLFATYDCNIKHSDVAVGLMVELCRCTGSKVNEEGEIVDPVLREDLLATPEKKKMTTTETQTTSTGSDQVEPPSIHQQGNSTDGKQLAEESQQRDQWRKVPPHLKELCAETIIGSMKCLFQDDHPSESTKEERRHRNSILTQEITPAPQSFSDLERMKSAHHLRNIKSKKRLMRKAAQLFNTKSSTGIEFLVNSGIVAEPVTPRNVASFLRNGLVVGLDKKAVGMYLGEIGKSPVAGKSPKVWERDWFHKEVLEAYCSLFHFDRQNLLDGLRMFLACFRLPGEAQQIDRILQAFADSCGNLCEESSQGALKLFSEDPKKAADVAFLLSFSIIMLNTDQHNDNIREDRKMKRADFVKNNTDYGRDITESGKELPREYLEAIYDNIREEEIKTEGEGADGSMTVERWKDVLRGSADDDSHSEELPSVADAEDLSELVLEQVWMPIMSAISALWGVKDPTARAVPAGIGSSGMHGAQGARLGMDMAFDMLVGVRQLGRKDIFCKIFKCVCKYSGLLDYSSNAADRSWVFVNSVEAQSAVVVALRMVRDTNGDIDIEGWKYIWAIIFELRDLKLLGGGTSTKRTSILRESDTDLLKDHRRRDWTMKMAKRGKSSDGKERKSSSGLFASVGRALFGSVEHPTLDDPNESRSSIAEVLRTMHGKEDHLVWDELAPSDDEDEKESEADEFERDFVFRMNSRLSLGAQFQSQLIREDLLFNQFREIPVTGLERVDDTRSTQISPRARVRKRLSKACDFSGIVSDSRFMDDESISNQLQALLSLLHQQKVEQKDITSVGESREGSPSSELLRPQQSEYPLSPASESFAEVLFCEIALKNRDRFSALWHNHLASHYHSRLKKLSQTFVEKPEDLLAMMSGPLEKSITGLLRISGFSVKRGDIANDVLFTWTLLDSCVEDENKKSLLDVLDRHIGEGVWRTTRCIDDSSHIADSGWHGILSLIGWSLRRGALWPPVNATPIGQTVGLAEDDPSLHAYRSLHFLMNVSEAKTQVPHAVGTFIQILVVTGDMRNCPKLSLAGLDLLQILSNQIEDAAIAQEEISTFTKETRDLFWKSNWLPVVEGMASASRSSPNPVSQMVSRYCGKEFCTIVQGR
jgi:hypothetical protein